MTVDELLQNKILELPKDWKKEGGESYYSYVVNKGKEYLDLIKTLDSFEIEGDDSYVGQIPNKDIIYDVSNILFNATFNSLRIYLDKADPTQAYNTFVEKFENENNPPFISPDRYLHRIRLKEKDTFYRIRVEKNYIVKDAKELFHVPFDFRHKIELKDSVYLDIPVFMPLIPCTYHILN